MYRVITRNVPYQRDDLNQKYYEGWELVSVVSCRGVYGNDEFIHYFKRIILNKKEERNEGDKDGVRNS